MSNRFLGGIVSAKPQTTSAFTSRASTGTYFNNLGQLVTAPINQPRLNYSFNGNPISTRYSLFSNSTGYLSTTSASAFAFGANNFTIEYWSYQFAVSDERRTIYSYSSNQQFIVGHSSNTVFFAATTSSNSLIGQPTTAAGTLVANQWNHIAVVRNGSTVTIYINGVSQATASFSTTAIRTDQTTLYVGNDPVTSGRTFNGYLSNVRIVNGVAVYTGNFTVPSAPLTATQSSGTNISAITGTSTTLLTCQNNGFTDFSPAPLTITNNGGVASTFLPPIYPSDFSGTGWGNPSVLIEPASTNIISYSQDFSSSVYWNLNGATVTSNATTAPDGTLTAAKIVETSATGSLHGIEQGLGATNGLAYTLSVYVKAAERGWFILDNTHQGVLNFRNYYNLATGTVGTMAGGNSQTTMTNAGNGWWRCTVTRPAGTYGSHRVCMYATTGDATPTYNGTVGVGVYVWGVQLEYQLGATSYIPTTSSAVTRSQDDVGPGQASGMYRLAEVQAQTSIDDQNTVQSYTLPYGAYFNGTNSYINYSQGSTLTFGTNNFTVECWIYLTALQSTQYIVDARDSTHQTNWAFGWGLNTFSQLTWYNGTSYTATDTSTTDAGTNKWNHIAYVRNGTTGTIYLNGVSVGSGTDSANYTITSSTTTIGSRYNYPIYTMTGYMTNLRIVNGVAVYTGAFSPPTSPLTTTQSAGTNISAITGTSTVLLTFQSNSIVDASSNNFSLTNNNVAPAGVTAFGSTYYWTAPADVSSVEVLVVAGGGGGGGPNGGGMGGGGGGGVVYNTSYTVVPGTIYPIVVGAGGAGGNTSGQGGNSVFSSIVAIGGGGGLSRLGLAGNNNGGSGGGGSEYPTPSNVGFGTPGQGYNGGQGYANTTGGGGGGAGGPGIGALSSTVAGIGGSGLTFTITGSAVTYGQGGGASTNNGAGGAPNGGAGSGGTNYGATTNGTQNTGQGGGGSYSTAPGIGGSGIVIVKYKRTNTKLAAVSNAAVVTQKFITSNIWTAPAGVTQVEALVVAGGGGGGNGTAGGGGGGGGVVYNSAISVTPGSTYSIAVGFGGPAATDAAAAPAYNGINSGIGGTTELITNGNFASGTTGWTATTSTNTSPSTGVFQMVPNASVNGYASQSITTVVSTSYTVLFTVIADPANYSRLLIGTTQNGNDIFAWLKNTYTTQTTGTFGFTFTATSTTTWITMSVGGGTQQLTQFTLVSVRAATVNAIGGGYGGSESSTVAWRQGGNGGSGGGTVYNNTTYGLGTSGQGNNGGVGYSGVANVWTGGGGGGAASAGGNASQFYPGYGGAGLGFTITGTLEYYGGGGGGSSQNYGVGTVYPGLGGIGGGGTGFADQTSTTVGPGQNGAPNTGGGGGAQANQTGSGGALVGRGDGGSGVVIIRYRVPYVATFLDSGSWTCPAGVTSVQALIVGGGGAGAIGILNTTNGGAGGAGGLIYSSSVAVTPGQTYSITVGQGGVTGSPYGQNGGNSSFNNLIAIGGGGGASVNASGTAASSGGSGGGGVGLNGGTNLYGGSGTYGQGNSGGNGTAPSPYITGSGGGAGGAGGAGAGGAGLAYSISGSSVTYAGGGGSGTNGATVYAGGSGGGGAGGNDSGSSAVSGIQNTGGGGGGSSGNSVARPGGSGGSGIVIIRWYGG